MIRALASGFLVTLLASLNLAPLFLLAILGVCAFATPPADGGSTDARAPHSADALVVVHGPVVDSPAARMPTPPRPRVKVRARKR